MVTPKTCSVSILFDPRTGKKLRSLPISLGEENYLPFNPGKSGPRLVSPRKNDRTFQRVILVFSSLMKVDTFPAMKDVLERSARHTSWHTRSHCSVSNLTNLFQSHFSTYLIKYYNIIYTIGRISRNWVA